MYLYQGGMGPSLRVSVLGRQEGDEGGLAGVCRGMRLLAVSRCPCWTGSPNDEKAVRTANKERIFFGYGNFLEI
jgi:hypothetical protein